MCVLKTGTYAANATAQFMLLNVKPVSITYRLVCNPGLISIEPCVGNGLNSNLHQPTSELSSWSIDNKILIVETVFRSERIVHKCEMKQRDPCGPQKRKL